MQTTPWKGPSWSGSSAPSIVGICRSPSSPSAWPSSSPKNMRGRSSPGDSIALPRPYGSSAGSCVTSAMTLTYWGETRSMTMPFWACAGSCGFPTQPSTAAASSTSKDLHRLRSGKNSLRPWSAHRRTGRRAMTYSYTQISQYLRCPRSYRHRYLDGWQEKDSRAALLFGRCFEKALSAYFRREDSAAVLFKEWGAHRDTQLERSEEHTSELQSRQ